MNRATEAIKLLKELAVWFNEGIVDSIKDHVPQMLALLEGN